MHHDRYKGGEVSLDLALKKAEFPVYGTDGTALNVPDVQGRGTVTVCCRVPTVYSNICGWFRDIKCDVFNNIIANKVWITVSNGTVNIYNSPYSGTLLRSISCRDIADAEEIM